MKYKPGDILVNYSTTTFIKILGRLNNKYKLQYLGNEYSYIVEYNLDELTALGYTKSTQLHNIFWGKNEI